MLNNFLTVSIKITFFLRRQMWSVLWKNYLSLRTRLLIIYLSLLSLFADGVFYEKCLSMADVRLQDEGKSS